MKTFEVVGLNKKKNKFVENWMEENVPWFEEMIYIVYNEVFKDIQIYGYEMANYSEEFSLCLKEQGFI